MIKFRSQPHDQVECSKNLIVKKILRAVFELPTSASLYFLEVLILYAIIQTGGKQYKVSEGDQIVVEKIDGDVDSEVVLDKVLSIIGDSVKVGKPFIDGAKVTAKIVEHGKEKKILVFKYKAKSNYRKRQGHRQPYTKLSITKIEG